MSTLSLCMVVKDEETTLRSVVRSFADLPDQVVIGVDAASNPETRTLAQDLADVCFEFDWHDDFSHARNQAIARCTGDTIFVLDGHERLAPGSVSKLKALLASPPQGMDVFLFSLLINVDAYGIPQLFFVQPRMFVGGKGIRYQNPVHNRLAGHDPEKTMAVPNILLIHNMPPLREEQRKDQRAQMNIRQLEADVKQHPDDARPLFYLGNTLCDLGRAQEAIPWYQKYLEISDFEPERAQTALQLSIIFRQQGELDEAAHFAREAVHQAWDRAEPYCVLGEIAGERRRWDEAIHWYRIAAGMPAPVSVMFLQGRMYSWLPHWQLCRLYDEVGRRQEALKACLKALYFRPGDQEMLASKEALIKGVLGKPHQSFDTWRYVWERDDM